MDINIKKIIKGAKKGGKVLRCFFGKSIEIEEKTLFANFRTEADLRSESAILKSLQKDFPDFNFLSEERGLIGNHSDYTFVIDPLDGTTNFILGIPNFSVSIGLFKDKEIIAGVVLNPILNHFYWAVSGKGAFLNGTKISISRKRILKNAIIGYDCDYGHYLERYFRNFLKKMEDEQVGRVLVNMSPALDLCRLAAGKIDGYINNKNEIYDFAAGKLIAKEAGALITDFNNKNEIDMHNNAFVATNGLIHKQLFNNIGLR